MSTFIEITKENMEQYIEKLMKLQENVHAQAMSKNTAHFFSIMTKEEVAKYILSDTSIVSVLESDGNLIAGCIFTFNPFIHTDLTSYIRNSPVYKSIVLSSYSMFTLISCYISNLKTYLDFKNTGVLTNELIEEAFKLANADNFYEDNPLRKKLSNILVDYGVLSEFGYPWLVSDDLTMVLSDEALVISKEYDKFISLFNHKYVSCIDTLPFALNDLTDLTIGKVDAYFSTIESNNNLELDSSLINQTIEHAHTSKKISAVTAAFHPDDATSREKLQDIGFKKFCIIEPRKNVLKEVMFKLF